MNDFIMGPWGQYIAVRVLLNIAELFYIICDKAS